MNMVPKEGPLPAVALCLRTERASGEPDGIHRTLFFFQGAILTTMLVSRNFSGMCSAVHLHSLR